MYFTDLDSITFDDIISLAEKGVAESRILDFKRDQIGTSDRAKKEFLKDISAFANTIGGTLLLGVLEKNGIISETLGIKLDDPDREILRLGDIVRSGINPRIPKVDMKWIKGENSDGFLAINVPRSNISPHQVVFQHDSKFYGRANNANYPMDVVEIRNAFLSNDSLPKKMRQYRDERLNLISSIESPVELEDGLAVVVHIIPEVSFLDGVQISPNDDNSLTPPIGNRSSVNSRYTIDGYLTTSGNYDFEQRPHPAYTLTSPSGIIESVVIQKNYGDHNLYPAYVEHIIVEEVRVRQRYFERLKINGPFYVFVCMVNTHGWRFFRDKDYVQHPECRSNLLRFPDVSIELETDTGRALRPIFDRFWNAFGFEKSLNYDDAGNWQDKR